MRTPPPRLSTPPTRPGFSPRRPQKRGPGTSVSAPRGGEGGQGRAPGGASSLPALASLGRWEGGQGQGQGHVGTCGPAEEMLGTGRRRRGFSQRGAGDLLTRPGNPAALTLPSPAPFATFGGVSVCVAVCWVFHPPRIRILSESQVFLRSRHLSPFPLTQPRGGPASAALCFPLLTGCQPFAHRLS